MTEMKRRIFSLSALSLLQYLLVHFVLVQQFPNSGDEQSYLFQATLFSQGKLYVEDPIYDRAHPLNKYIAADAIDDIGGRRFSKYPPGWPALLSVGVMLGMAWIVGPLFAALTVFLMCSYVRKRIGHELVNTTWWLLALCPFFFLSVASFGSHTSTMACLFAAFYLYDDALDGRQERGFRLFVAGALLGFSALIRYIDWIPLLGLIAFSLLRRKRIKGVALLGIGFALLWSCHPLYNYLLTGSPMTSPTALYAKGGLHDHLIASWQGFEVTAVRLARLIYAFPPAILLILFWRRYHGNSRLQACTALFAMNIGIYFFYVASVGGPGPRYLLPYFPFLVLAVVEIIRSKRREHARSRPVWVSAICAQIVCGLVYVAMQTHQIYQRRDLERLIASMDGVKKIILLETGTDDMELRDLIRNPPEFWSADTLYFAYDDDVRLKELLQRFPEYKVFVYRYPSLLHPFR